MKIWRALYEDNDSSSGVVQVFATSEQKLRELLPDSELFPLYSVEKIEVPSTAEALCRWLNSYCGAA